MDWKSLHINTANVIGFTLIGVLTSTLTSQWFSCADGSIEVVAAWMFGSALAFTGIGITVTARHYGYDKQLHYYVELILRILLVYALVTTALLKAEGHFYNYTLFDGQTKLADLESQTFANAFYGFSPMFQSYVGYVVLGGLALICFKQTQRIGNILLAAILTNAVILNMSFDSCFVYKNGIYLAVVSYFIFSDLPSYFNFFSRNKSTVVADYHPLTGHPHLNNSASLLKVILLTGLFFYNQDYIRDIKKYRSRNAESPITGVWNVKSIEFLANVPEENKKNIEDFKAIILDKGRFGAVKIADSLSFFEYLIVPDDNHLEIWNFQDFYDLDIKGQYNQISKDSMVYIGRNNKDSLTIVLKREIVNNEK